MYKYRILKAVILQAFLSITAFAYAQNADTRQIRVKQDLSVTQSTVHKQIKTKQDLPGYVSSAIAKGYQASVLMWQIDPLTGNRMSAQFSGVVVSQDGVIMSAAHVVMSGNTYRVMYANGMECVARGLGRITLPPDHMVPDAAMLKITTSGSWPYAEMGWSSSMKAGQPCISIAYPESLEQRKPNVRFGQISTLKNEYGFLQSTCIMEPGDSGGPLFDLLGRVIGIHSGIRIPEDINYEVPVDTYRKYWPALSQAKDYQTLPADSVPIGKDSLKSLLSAIPVYGSISHDLAGTAKKLSATCIKIRSKIAGTEQQVAGTLISTKGLVTLKKNGASAGAIKSLDLSVEAVVISKSSMIGDNPVAVNTRGAQTQLTVLARDRANDLVLLLPASNLGKGITLVTDAANSSVTENVVANSAVTNSSVADNVPYGRLGKFLISPMIDTAARIGVVASLSINLPNSTSYGYLGATTQLKNDKLLFKSVLPNSAAALAGLKAGDIISTVDGVTVQDELDFVKAIGKYQAGDTVAIAISTNDKNELKKIVLSYPPQKTGSHPAGLFYGGKSIRRDGFNNVFTQDATLRPTECGGPVYDMNGNFAGINIARFSRTSTIIMPAKEIIQFLAVLK
jgi:serine protease Do